MDNSAGPQLPGGIGLVTLRANSARSVALWAIAHTPPRQVLRRPSNPPRCRVGEGQAAQFDVQAWTEIPLGTRPCGQYVPRLRIDQPVPEAPSNSVTVSPI